MSTHTIGNQPAPAPHVESYGDVRDVIRAAPAYYPGDGYSVMDLFPVRFDIIAAMQPAPVSVFEFGAYRGYFLLTACAAAPTIRRVGWCDNETDLPGSNDIVKENILWLRPHAETICYTEAYRSILYGEADLVQVDAAHGYANCLTDLIWAAELNPRVLMVDDYMAHDAVRRATREFASWRGWHIEEFETVNGLAVLTKEGRL